MKDSSVAERSCLKCCRTVYRNITFRAVRNSDVELQRRLGLGVTELSVIGLQGPSPGNEVPHEEQEEKEHGQYDLDQKAEICLLGSAIN